MNVISLFLCTAHIEDVTEKEKQKYHWIRFENQKPTAKD